MNKENFQNVVKKISVIEPMNDPLSYKFTVENNVLKVPFINSSESIKGYVQCNDFELEDSTFSLCDAKFLGKTLSMLDENIRIDMQPSSIVLRDDKYRTEIEMVDEATIMFVDSLESCYLFDDDKFDATIIFGKEFIDNFIKVATNEKYIDQDTFTLVYNSKKENFRFTIGKKAKIKFSIDGTKDGDNDVNSILRISDFVNILSANKDCVEGYLYLDSEVARLEFTNKNDVKSVYNIIKEENEH